MVRTFCLFVLLFVIVVAAGAEYLPQGDAAVGGARRIVLIYNGRGHRKCQTPDFVPLITRVDSKGRPTAQPMFDTFLVLPLSLDTGHAFCPGFEGKPADRAALDAYMNTRLFGGRDHLRKLDAAVEHVAKALHKPAFRVKVFLTLPYPIPAQADFGAVTKGGPSLDLSKSTDRLAAVEWYRKTATELWRKARYKHLDLVGWYWVEEAAREGDTDLIRRVSGSVHGAGKRFLFIPYNGSPGMKKWREMGFDAAIFQPNYFFNDSNWPESTIDKAALQARDNGMGLEVELDERVLTEPAYQNRYQAYLAAARRQSAGRGVMAWYMGVAALVDCARSTDPNARSLYDATADFIRDTSVGR